MSNHGVICGLKVTHDGAVAVLDGDRLVFSVEAEKIGNRRRHSRLSEMADVVDQLAAHGLDVGDIDAVSVDGWLQAKDGRAAADIVAQDGRPMRLDLAHYAVIGTAAQRLDAGVRMTGSGLPLGEKTFQYASYPHATGHAFASYCTSPFAGRHQPSLVLVWDGGMPATLYHMDPARGGLTSLGAVLEVSGALYPVFATHLEPFRVSRSERLALAGLGDFAQLEALLPVSGKAMAYAALAAPNEDAIEEMTRVTAAMLPIGVAGAYLWSHQVLKRLAPLGLSDAELLASFQEHLYRLLFAGLTTGPAGDHARSAAPLCLSGGCALNIKWNARLRASGAFSDVWVPPFPNDAGSAIGAACAELARRSGRYAISWSVFAGPPAGPVDEPPPGWSGRPCSIEEVATILHAEGEPVALIDGRAELGPRALGHRSLVAPAGTAAMRDRLNEIKLREWYRPVAPICLESRAAEVFDPGGPDPYMLFEHRVRPAWLDRVAAVTHVDGSARLQTVGPDNPLLFRLLRAYDQLSGIPVLCNTSANAPGCGFFPDAVSAMRWGGVRYVWCAGRLYQRDGER